jgi:hypothetical protein
MMTSVSPKERRMSFLVAPPIRRIKREIACPHPDLAYLSGADLPLNLSLEKLQVTESAALTRKRLILICIPEKERLDACECSSRKEKIGRSTVISEFSSWNPSASPAGNKKDYAQHQEYNEQNLRNSR